MILPLFVTLVGAISSHFASLPEMAGQPRLWLYLMLPNLPLALLACLALWRKGRMKERLLPHRGDVFLGVLTAVVVVIATWSGRYLVMPHGSPREAWLARLYLQLGDPQLLETARWLPLALLLGPVLDEIVWRGWIQEILSEKLGPIRGLLLTSGFYAVTALPTALNLADPTVGANVLCPLLAIVGGLVWGYATHLSGRATPAMISHATFVYFSVMQFRPGL
ncbi:MAG: lysostaphin resistance A-like protein [Myxococcales bacterium]